MANKCFGHGDWAKCLSSTGLTCSELEDVLEYSVSTGTQRLFTYGSLTDVITDYSYIYTNSSGDSYEVTGLSVSFEGSDESNTSDSLIAAGDIDLSFTWDNGEVQYTESSNYIAVVSSSNETTVSATLTGFSTNTDGDSLLSNGGDISTDWVSWDQFWYPYLFVAAQTGDTSMYVSSIEYLIYGTDENQSDLTLLDSGEITNDSETSYLNTTISLIVDGISDYSYFLIEINGYTSAIS